jgi:glutamyl-tRNA synthetase
MLNQEIRVRFAPSPTGPLHIGGVRTALYNYLFAKKHKGKFILRIEDTDQKRFVQGAEEYIIKSLKWCGIDFDESINKDGQYGPYRQSERKHLYRKYVDKLLNNGTAYYAFDTQEELTEMRNIKAKDIAMSQYNVFTRLKMKNSLSLSQEEVKRKLDSKSPYVVRIKIPEKEEIKVFDIIRGQITVNSSKIDDKVLFKSDGMPTYHLANIVDDHLMKITHVIRGEEWLASAPLHVLLYKYLGWEKTMPYFVHLPLLLKPNGNGKLSKRDGDSLGFPVFPLEWTDPKTNEKSSGYKESGYFPEAFINMLALLGWNPGTEQELFTMDELIQKFSFEHVGKSGAKFNPEKAKWFNQQYLRKKDNKELADLLLSYIKTLNTEEDKTFEHLNKAYNTDINKENISKIIENKNIINNKYLSKVCGLMKERACFVKEIFWQATYFFKAPVRYNEKAVRKKWKENTPFILSSLKNELNLIENFDARTLEPVFEKFLEENNLNIGQLMNALRITVLGDNKGPNMLDVAEILGKDEILKRISLGIKNIKKLY